MTTKEIKNTVYVSEDGVEFESEIECKKHEMNLHSDWMLSQAIMAPLYRAWDEEPTYRGAMLVIFNSKDDVERAKEFLEYRTEVESGDCCIDPQSYPCVGLLEWDGSWATLEDIEDVYSKALNIVNLLSPYLNLNEKNRN